MIKNGKLIQWNDDKGFGFVSTENGERYFLHIKAIKRTTKGRPQIGDLVTFEAGRDGQGRLLALAAVVGQLARPIKKKVTSSGWDLIDSLTLLLLILLPALIWRSGLGQLIFPVVLLLSICAFFAYRRDKTQAQNQERRTPEDTLHGWALLGGWPGAWIAQRVFRHKTQKGSFRWTYLLTVIGNLVGLWFLPVVYAAATSA